MKTKLNMTDDRWNQKLNETLVRDSRQLKVKTNIHSGIDSKHKGEID